MVKYLHKILAIVMVLTLCAGLVPYVSAEESIHPHYGRGRARGERGILS